MGDGTGRRGATTNVSNPNAWKNDCEKIEERGMEGGVVSSLKENGREDYRNW